MYLVIGIVLAFIVSFWKDNRSLWNPVLFLLSLILSYISLSHLFYKNGYENIQLAFYVVAFVLLPFLIFLSGIFLIYNGVILLKREGRSKANYLSTLFGIVILVFFPPKKKHYDFIIIHGAGLLGGEKVTPLLKRRIDKAVEAYHKSKNSNIKIIASGGQGADEKISEAQAIYNYILEETDVSKESVLLEDKSRTTYENLLFSKEIGEQLVENPCFLFVTNDYHVFRTSTYARKLNMKGDGLGCRTAGYYIPSAFIREYVALCVKMKWLFLAFYVPILVIILLAYKGVIW